MSEKKLNIQHIQKQSSDDQTSHEINRLCPKTDILESKEEIIIYSEMPGVEDRNVNVSFEENIISISGDVQWLLHNDKHASSTEEMPSGRYERSFSILSDINVENISAKIKDGVLKVILPKSERLKPRRIEVKVE